MDILQVNFFNLNSIIKEEITFQHMLYVELLTLGLN